MANIQIVRDRFHAKNLIIAKWKRDRGKCKINSITLLIGDGFSKECFSVHSYLAICKLSKVRFGRLKSNSSEFHE